MDWVMQFILGVRKIRSGYDIKPGQPLPVLLDKCITTRPRTPDHQRAVHQIPRPAPRASTYSKPTAPTRIRHRPGRHHENPHPHGRPDRQSRRTRAPGQEIAKREQEVERTEAKLANSGS